MKRTFAILFAVFAALIAALYGLLRPAEWRNLNVTRRL